jgi:hypothetical protein
MTLAVVRRGRVSYAYYEMGHRKRWLRGEELEAVMAAEATLALVRGDTLSTETLRAQLKARAEEKEKEAVERSRVFDLRKLEVGGGDGDVLDVVGTGSIGKRALSREKRRKQRESSERSQAEVRAKYGLGGQGEDEEDFGDGKKEDGEGDGGGHALAVYRRGGPVSSPLARSGAGGGAGGAAAPAPSRRALSPLRRS